MADGSVIFNVELDDKDAQAKFNRLSKTVDSLNDKISLTQRKKLPLLEQAEKLTPVLDAAKAKLAEMQNAPKSTYSAADISEQKERVKELQAEWDRVQDTLDKYSKTIQDATIEMEWAQEKAGEIAAQMSTAEHSTEEMAKATKKANKSMGLFATRLRGILLSAFVFNILSSGFRELTEWMGKVVKSNDEARGAIAKLKGALLTLVQPLVGVVIPAFTKLVNILTRVVSEIAKVVSALFGTTAEESAEAAESLYDEMNAIEGVGEAAKEAAGSLAAFDEINQLANETASSSSLDSEVITPDFSGGLIGGLTFSLTDILFKWKDLTAEDILAKIVTALGAIAGGIIGFTIGGPGGAAIGVIIGAGLGLKLANVLFNGDGKIDTEELLRTLVTALGALAGGVIGFSLGGIGGAAIGVVVGASIGLSLSKMLFNGDGKMDQEEILKSVVTALAAIAGGVIGFVVGGPVGGALGLLATSTITVSILDGVFNGDGKISKDEIATLLVDALTILAGGVIGFAIGGPAGALIGVVVGAGVVLTISGLDAQGGKAADIAEKFLDALVNALFIICGGIIGFTVGGGPGGAIIGMVIAAAITFTLDNSSISFSGGSKGVVWGAGRDIVSGVEEGAEEEMSSVGKWLKEQIVDPFIEDFKTLFGIHSPSTVMAELGGYLMEGLMGGVTDKIAAVVATFTGLWEKIKEVFSHISDWFKGTFSDAWQAVKDVFSSGGKIFDGIKDGILSGLKAVINALISGINKVISVPFNGINSALKTIRNVSILGVKPFSWISTISIPQIPKLAEGAVIPPNREFLAVLGDQKSGTNIEAPLSTIEQAVENVLNRSGNAELLEAILAAIKAGQVIKVNETVFGKTAVRAINNVTNAAGKTLLKV